MPFSIVRQDITRMQTDAIVNAANPGLLMGGGVCGAIFRAAGADRLQQACRKAGPIRTGEAAITPGFDLPARFIIHAAGPVYRDHSPLESERLLRSAYREALALAAAHECESIAFPLISGGIYGYPKPEALRVATEAIRDFLQSHEMEVYLTVFDREAFQYSRDLMGKVESYIDETYVGSHRIARSGRLDREISYRNLAPVCGAPGLEDRIGHLDEPFHRTLLRLIDARGMTDSQVYKRANLDRRLFSKIRTGKNDTPGKRTVLALAVALELNLEETDDLLERAGYALSHSRKFDVIVEYFILSGNYDIFAINEVLFQYDQPLLGAGA